MSDIKDLSLAVALTAYLSWTVIFLVGHVRDFLASLFWGGVHQSTGKDGDYAPLRQEYEDFYTRRAYYRVIECFHRPVTGPPDRVMDVVVRTPNSASSEEPQPTGEVRRCLNLGSYNYLGFASQDEYCTPRCKETLDGMGLSTCAPAGHGGNTPVHKELERTVAEFLQQEDAIVFGMGFATNSFVIPVLCGPGDLIVSDALNHKSIVDGARGSGARVKVFKHNNAVHLDAVLRQAIAHGQPRTRRPWNKIMILVEGIYSMEGEICALSDIVAVKKKYGVYLYLDEAHSIGALGATGRGTCEQLGVPFSDVDILMGTFTKSFGSCGGYIASSRDVVNTLRAHSPASQMVLSAFNLINGKDGSSRGSDKIAKLKRNSNYFRWHLMEMGFAILGDWDSPVIPIMLYSPGALLAFSRLCFENHVAVVVVGFPATSLLTARVRICISAAHELADLDYGLKVLQRVGAQCGCLFRRRVPRSMPPLDRVLDKCTGVERAAKRVMVR